MAEHDDEESGLHLHRPEDATTGPDRKLCPHCGRVKSLGAFYVRPNRKTRQPSGWCRVCVRIGVTEYHATAEYRAWRAEYLARPEVKARRAAADRKRSEARKAQRHVYATSARGRVLRCRAAARRKLRDAKTDERKAALIKLIAAYDRELERMDIDMNGRKVGRPHTGLTGQPFVSG